MYWRYIQPIHISVILTYLLTLYLTDYSRIVVLYFTPGLRGRFPDLHVHVLYYMLCTHVILSNLCSVAVQILMRCVYIGLVSTGQIYFSYFPNTSKIIPPPPPWFFHSYRWEIGPRPMFRDKADHASHTRKDLRRNKTHPEDDRLMNGIEECWYICTVMQWQRTFRCQIWYWTHTIKWGCYWWCSDDDHDDDDDDDDDDDCKSPVATMLTMTC